MRKIAIFIVKARVKGAYGAALGGFIRLSVREVRFEEARDF
jgi:hypothetical protein